MWNKLKNAIFQEDPAAVKPQPTDDAAREIITDSHVLSPGEQSAQEIKFVEAIRKGVYAKSTAFTQLMTAADALKTIIADDVTRFKAAYATAGNGRTPPQIINAVDIHLAEIDSERGRFEAALQQQLGEEIKKLDSQVRTSQATIVELTSEIDLAQRRIIELQQEIAKQNAKMAGAQSLAATKKIEMQNTSNTFSRAAEKVRQELTVVKAAITSALK